MAEGRCALPILGSRGLLSRFGTCGAERRPTCRRNNWLKLRELFVRPHAAEHKFFYNVNFEFSVNRLYWEPKRITSEVRPIVGAHLGKVDFIFNPIVDTDYTGGVNNLEFVPATRLAYHLNSKWAVAVEEYSDFGPLTNFRPVSGQFQEVWAVFDHAGKGVDIEAGVGVGVTGGADRLTFKLMVSRDVNPKPKPIAAARSSRP